MYRFFYQYRFIMLDSNYTVLDAQGKDTKKSLVLNTSGQYGPVYERVVASQFVPRDPAATNSFDRTQVTIEIADATWYGTIPEGGLPSKPVPPGFAVCEECCAE